MKKGSASGIRCILFCVAAGVCADTHYVAMNGADVFPHTNWTDAAISIQNAVDAASPGDTILVSNGVYTSASQIEIEKDVTVKSVNGPAVTHIDGQHAHRCVDLNNNFSTLSGFTILNGYTETNEYGGGVYCLSTNPVITNCTLFRNRAGHGGGSCNGTLKNCTLSQNTAIYQGGGSHGSTLNDCTLEQNTAYKDGGGSYEGTLNRCILNDNSVFSWYNKPVRGGGSYGGTLNNCILSGNAADKKQVMVTSDGGGSYNSTLTHCTVVGNFANGNGGGCYGGTLENCIVYYNQGGDPGETDEDNWYNPGSATYSYCCTTPVPAGKGHMDSAPAFADPAYHLMPNSPCINTGLALAGFTNDVYGTPRPLKSTTNGSADPDIGACEFAGSGPDADADGLSDQDEVYLYGSNPQNADSDGDGRDDGDEAAIGLNPAHDESVMLASVADHPDTFGLYTTNSIGDLAMGGIMIQTSNDWIRLDLQLEKCTHLGENVWSNVGDAVEWLEPSDDSKMFFRVRGKKPE